MDTIIALTVAGGSLYLSINQTDQILKHTGFINHMNGDIPPALWLALPLFLLYLGTGYTLYKLYKHK